MAPDSTAAAVTVSLGLPRRRIVFTGEALQNTGVLRTKRLPWAHIRRATFSDITDEDREVVGRRVMVAYLRDPSRGEPPPMPTPLTLAAFRAWDHAHFRHRFLPLRFPAPGAPEKGGSKAALARQTIRREFLARGYALPD